MALAYALDPVADWLEKRGLNRTIATFLILVLIVLAFAAIFILIVPILVNQLIDFAQRLPELHRAAADDVRTPAQHRVGALSRHRCQQPARNR